MPSSVIAHISYEISKQELKVIFNSGDIYVYRDVPEKIYKEFKASISKGTYLNRKLKKLFTGEKINA
jgi:hypothetical protein